MIVTPHIVKAWVENLPSYTDDPARAHQLEDSFHNFVLESIAVGQCTDPQECARLVLESSKVEFPRLCR